MAQLALTSAVRSISALGVSAVRHGISGLLQPRDEVGRLTDFQLQASSEGAPLPVVFGRMRVTGQVIWAAHPVESVRTRSAGGGKGGPKVDEYSYTISFAVALCEGPITGIGTIWADSTPLDRSGLVIRIYKGDEAQMSDPLIEAIEGANGAPAYRGLAYVVFEDLPLAEFGNRIPNLSFEVLGGLEQASEPSLENLTRGVCLIPASGEFAYATEPVMREIAEGAERSENHHTSRANCDLEAALDDLQSQLPECRSVALVTSWFGDDLRCEHCTLRPGVEILEKQTRPLTWRVAGLERGQAHLVSQTADGPVYGGTPSDETVIQAIKALKARGLEVTLYPFILMDVPAGNGLPDPYGQGEQAVFPWRGRITCFPAAGEPGTVDKTASAQAQVDAFFGAASASDFSIAGETITYTGPAEWRFNRFILHHAALAAAAGGVESFIIGSEMRGLSTIRSGPESYPAVAHLKALAGQARAILGAQVQISYAADWSEYFGHQPADESGDRTFHLDPVWSDPDIDFVGIDWYAPLSDWRDGEAHLDAQAGAPSIYDRSYLGDQVEGGEGFEWYYASAADRDAQTRTLITDGAHQEPWVFRYKDLRSWWSMDHFNRVDGVRSASSTDWQPGMKPIRLVEVGCPAVDKGANQPNVFVDPKSSESTYPYFSRGVRDDLIQRRYVETVLNYWAQPGQNPSSTLDGRPMLDLDHCHVWTWDARPFPEFPARGDVWSDGSNWKLGHWLTGRAGQSSLQSLTAQIACRAGMDELDTSQVEGVVAGYVLEGPVTARTALERLGAVFGFTLTDQSIGPVLSPIPASLAASEISSDQLVLSSSDAERRAQLREPVETLPGDARVLFLSSEGDYRTATASARGLDHIVDGTIQVSVPVLSDRNQAQAWAQGLLSRARAQAETLRLTLPPSLGFVETGDRVQLSEDTPERAWQVSSLDGLSARSLELTGVPTHALQLWSGPVPGGSEPAPIPSRPLLRALDLPANPTDIGGPSGLWVVGYADPWPGELVVYAGVDVQQSEERARIPGPGYCGELETPLGWGAEGRWDLSDPVRVRLYSGNLASATDTAVLAGENRLAIETETGWEVISFANATLIAPGRYEISRLLRGLGGSRINAAPAGARVVVLDQVGAVAPVSSEERSQDLTLIAVAPGLPRTDPSARTITTVYNAAGLRPLAPVHLRTRWSGADLLLSWVRRGRIEADSWGAGEIPLGEDSELYQLRLLNAGGEPVFESELQTRQIVISEAELSALFATGLDGARFEVAQIAASFGPGQWGEAVLNPSAHV